MNLSGFWAGHFHYPDNILPSVKFDCEITQTGSQFTGHTTETAELRSVPHFLVGAKIEGFALNKQVSFLKTYQNDDLAIEYEGKINLWGNQIKGVWIRHDWSGTFIMKRDKENQTIKKTVSIANDTNI